PFINDTRENMEGILDYCIRAKVYGIICFGMGVTLRDGDREYFYAALDRHFPGMKERYQRQYGHAYELQSAQNGELMALFRDTCERNGIVHDVGACFAYLQELPHKYEQLRLF
ncbi:MAG: radical SAM protein, partial [Lachnospiraceae bacterium]|nr:radical SAM protein [Lachnospiraceae bacterium]